MKSPKSLVYCALLAFATTGLLGCTGTMVRIPNVPERAYDSSAGKQLSAEASGFQLLLWIPIGTNQVHQQCYQSLQLQAQGHFITDVRFQDSWTYAFVGTVYTVKMEATAYPYVSS